MLSIYNTMDFIQTAFSLLLDFVSAYDCNARSSDKTFLLKRYQKERLAKIDYIHSAWK